MALTPQDLQQIASIVAAGQSGYLPPYLLQQQLAFQSRSFLPSDTGDILCQANANRVWLCICGQPTWRCFPTLCGDVQGDGFIIPSSGVVIVTVHRDGVIPQLEWKQEGNAGSPWVVMEQIWQPVNLTGLGIV